MFRSDVASMTSSGSGELELVRSQLLASEQTIIGLQRELNEAKSLHDEKCAELERSQGKLYAAEESNKELTSELQQMSTKFALSEQLVASLKEQEMGLKVLLLSVL